MENFDGAFDHLTDLELVLMRRQLKEADHPEDHGFLEALDAELKTREYVRLHGVVIDA